MRAQASTSHGLNRCPQAGQVALTKTNTAGEVIFASASTQTHQVSNGLPTMNRAHFRLRQQYQK
jgi:hypothetical protein